MAFKSGFVNIVGRPNVGKSTLMNALVGERMSIITNKPQTTRHRIIGILSGEDFQFIFSDTPGLIEAPSYKMQESMNRFVHSTFEDADIMLFVVDVNETYEDDHVLLQKLASLKVPVFLVLNKIDTIEGEKLKEVTTSWKDRLPFAEIIPVSALQKINTERLLQLLLEYLPEGPEYYPRDQLSDRPERFFVSEIIREKIIELYHQEIPYSVQVDVTAFKEGTTTRDEPIVRIEALIFVERKSQKPILIGKGGSAIKELGKQARLDLEKFLEQKVFLELFVKIRENWRDDERTLDRFGYR